MGILRKKKNDALACIKHLCSEDLTPFVNLQFSKTLISNI